MDKNVQELFDDLTKDLGIIYSEAIEYYGSYKNSLVKEEEYSQKIESLRSENSEWQGKIDSQLNILEEMKQQKETELTKQREKRNQLVEREKRVNERESAVSKEEDKDSQIKHLRDDNTKLTSTIKELNVEIGEKERAINGLQGQIIQMNKENEATKENSCTEGMISLEEVHEKYILKSESVTIDDYNALRETCTCYCNLCRQYEQKYGRIESEGNSNE